MNLAEKAPVAMTALAGAVIAIIAIGNLPSGYYSFARWALTLIAIVCVVISSQIHQRGWLFGFLPIAILFNPFEPIYLTRSTWLPLDVVAAAVFVAFAIVIIARKANRPSSKQ